MIMIIMNKTPNVPGSTMQKCQPVIVVLWGNPVSATSRWVASDQTHMFLEPSGGQSGTDMVKQSTKMFMISMQDREHGACTGSCSDETSPQGVDTGVQDE